MSGSPPLPDGLSEALIDRFQQDGVIVLPTLIDQPWRRRLEAMIERDLEKPGPFFHNFRANTGKYHATFSHRINGPLAAAAFRRYFDHLDIDSDGVEEIVLQGWQFGGDTFLSVLGWREGKWQEIYRTRANWCLDERKAAD